MDEAEAFELCAKYLNGSWSTLTLTDFTLEPILGGLVNALYLCSVPAHSVRKDEPNQVVLRAGKNPEVTADTSVTGADGEILIVYILSKLGMGPKLYGVHPAGRIEEYIPSRTMSISDQTEDVFDSIMARKVAQFHSLHMPIVKDLKVFICKYANLFQEAAEAKDEEPSKQKYLDIVRRINIIAKNDLWFEQMAQLNARIVFCHNDLQRLNILVRTDGGEPRQDKNVTLVDYECCSYNFRGYDIANYFRSKVYEYSRMVKSGLEYPSEASRRFFIQEYLKEWKKLRPDFDEQIDNVDHLMKEVDLSAPITDILVGSFLIICVKEKHVWDLGLSRLKMSQDV